MEAPGPLRAVRTWEEAQPDGESDRAVREAMLLSVGELGYGATTVATVTERAGITEERFQRRFGGKEACFSAAYIEALEAQTARIRARAAAAPTWKAGFEAALDELLTFVAEQPLLAKALLVEVKAVRGEAWAAHQKAAERLIAAIDRSRQEPGARVRSNPIAAGFVFGAVEETLCIEIVTGRAAEVESLFPDLTRIAFLQLFGEENGGAGEVSPRSPAAPPQRHRRTASG